MVNTSFGLSIYLANFPEWDKICHSLHLGLTGKRSQYAGRIDPEGLPSCNRCYQAMIKTFQLQFCDRCCNWEYGTSSKARFFDSTAHSNYPKQCCPNNPHIFPVNRTANETHLVTFRQTFKKSSRRYVLPTTNILKEFGRKSLR